MDMPVQVPVDNPDADTEWNDILRKHGVIPEKPPSPTQLIDEAILEARKLANEQRLEDKTIEELDELEDDEDEAFLATYRQQRLQEMKTVNKQSLYGQVIPLQKPDYSREVTDASRHTFVIVHLMSSMAANLESQVLTRIFGEAAARFQTIKFCSIQADMCIENYPERNCPTILIYTNGEIGKQIVTLKQLRGVATTLQDLCNLLVEIGALENNDFRLKNLRNQETQQLKQNDTADEDDWD